MEPDRLNEYSGYVKYDAERGRWLIVSRCGKLEPYYDDDDAWSTYYKYNGHSLVPDDFLDMFLINVDCPDDLYELDEWQHMVNAELVSADIGVAYWSKLCWRSTLDAFTEEMPEGTTHVMWVNH